LGFIEAAIGNSKTRKLRRNLASADCQTVSLVHSLVLCLDFIAHAHNYAHRHSHLDQHIVAQMYLGFEFGVVKGVQAFDDLLSTLPAELQPFNLHPNYFRMMGVDRQANKLASCIPYILMSAELADLQSERAKDKYRGVVDAAHPVLLPPRTRYKTVPGKNKKKAFQEPAKEVVQHPPATDKEAFWRLISRRPGLFAG